MPTFSSLTAISPLDGRYQKRLTELVPFSSEMSLIKGRVEVECKYVIALSKMKLVRKLTKKEVAFLEYLGPQMDETEAGEVKKIEEVTRHDVKAVERYIRQKVKGSSLEDVTEMIHLGLTSEDINNLAYRLLADRARTQVMLPNMTKLINDLVKLAEETADLPMLARTHGQPAVPTTLGKEVANMAIRLHLQRQKLEAFQLTGKLNGAVGNYNALKLVWPDVDWPQFSSEFVQSLGLLPNVFTTQINPYDDLSEMFQILQRFNSILVDINQDFWRYISDNWFLQQIKKGEVGSSTMPQKVNPIDFENSEGNLQLANSLLEGMCRKLGVSRLQRDLSDSTTIRNVGVALGYCLLAYKSTVTGLSRVRPNPEMITEELNANWNILAEGVQTVLRKAGVADPYSLLAELSKGHRIGTSEWQEWVKTLPVEKKIQHKLKNLSPETYIGEAENLTRLIILEIKNQP